MKLKFTTEIAVITLALHEGTPFSAHDLADMSEAVKAALKPYAQQAVQMQEQALAKSLRADAANPRLSAAGRRQAERRLARLQERGDASPSTPEVGQASEPHPTRQVAASSHEVASRLEAAEPPYAPEFPSANP